MENMELEALKIQLYHRYISQTMLANHMGVHRSYVSKVFNGKIRSEKIIHRTITAARELLEQNHPFSPRAIKIS